MFGAKFTPIEEDDILGMGYKVSYERNQLTNEHFETCESYIQQRLRLNHLNLDWNLQKQRRFGVYITGIPIKLYNEVDETHLCSVREDWFMHGRKIFSTPYAREITVDISFRGGEYLSFSDDPKIVISSRTELCDFNSYKYKTFRVSDPRGLCPDLKSGAFRNFPEYNKEIFKQVFGIYCLQILILRQDLPTHQQ